MANNNSCHKYRMRVGLSAPWSWCPWGRSACSCPRGQGRAKCPVAAPPPPATSNQQPSQQPSQQASKNFLPLLSSTLDPCAEERRPYSTDFPACFFFILLLRLSRCAVAENESHIQPISVHLFLVFTTGTIYYWPASGKPQENRG